MCVCVCVCISPACECRWFVDGKRNDFSDKVDLKLLKFKEMDLLEEVFRSWDTSVEVSMAEMRYGVGADLGVLDIVVSSLLTWFDSSLDCRCRIYLLGM